MVKINTDQQPRVSLQDVLERLEDVTERNGKYRAPCPAHDGETMDSLSVIEGDNGKVVTHCFGQGCSYQDIMTALGLWNDAPHQPSSNGSRRKKQNKKQEDKQEKTYTTKQVYSRPVYEFRNPAGKVWYVQRHKGAYYRPVGEDRWVANLDGVAKLPYRLPDLIEGVRTGKTVFHVEGCKDADTGTERLKVPTTTTGGVGTWRSEFRTYYAGADVVILPDNDPEGLEYAHKVAGDLVGVARSVKVVELPGLPEKGDLTDFMEAGGTPEQVFEAVEDAPHYHAEDADDVSNVSNVSNSQSFQDLKDLPDPAAFPLQALPPTVRKFTRELAASVGCPVDYVGVSVLAAVSAAIGDTRRLVIKRDWSEGACVYAMIVGGPASKKSPAMNLALKPVRKQQMALKAEYDRQRGEYEIALANWKKSDNPDPADKPKKPVLGRTYADDTTVERLADILNENPRGVAITKDELSGWLGSMNAYKQGGKGADRQFWLSAHTNQPIAVDRKSVDEPVIVARPFVSIIGGIQPEVLPDFGKDRGDGLIDRFIAAYPEPRLSRWTEDEVSEQTSEAYHNLIRRMYRLEHAYHDGDTFPSKVRMTEEAKALFVKQYDALHVELESPGFPQRLRPAWGKLEAYLARFALILAMTRVAELEEMGGGPVERVEREDMEGATRLLSYFKNHARRVFTGLYGDSMPDNLAADLRDFLIEHGGRWEGSAKELHESLVSDHKPERPADFSKVIRAISKRSPLLEFEELPRTPSGYRPFRLTLRNADIADIADTTPEEEEVEGTL